MNLKWLNICIVLIFSTYVSFAQNINLANFYVIQDDKEVLLYWTIDAGPTCNGMTVWRSTDNLNYEEIGYIAGVCGSTSSSLPYNFKDTNPVLNKINYYKLRLGFSQFSEVQSLYLEYIKPGTVIIKPNPSTDDVSITFNNDKNETYNIKLINSAGSIVFEKLGIRENKITFSASSYENGIFYIVLMDSGGGIIKDKLLISK